MRTDNKFTKFIFLLTVLGILVSGWLLSLHFKFTSGLAGLTESCSIIPLGPDSQGCEKIAVSDYSRVLGIPLAAIAMGFYFTLLGLLIWSLKNPQACYETYYVSFFLSSLSIFVTLLMAFLSRVKVQSFCIGCSILWLVNLGLWPLYARHLQIPWNKALSESFSFFSKSQFIRKRIYGSFIAGIVFLVIVVVVALVFEATQKDAFNFGPADKAINDYRVAPQLFLPPETTTGPQAKVATGSGKLVMQIVEFSDLQCPACRMAAKFLKPFLLKHSEDVSFAYHHFPLDGACNPFVPNGMHPMACATARHAICAADQGKFYDFHDAIFDNQENLSQSLLNSTVEQLGLNQSQLAACLKDSKTESTLQQDMQWGNLIGLESTPTILINGRKMVGAIAPAQLEALYQALKKGELETHAH